MLVSKQLLKQVRALEDHDPLGGKKARFKKLQLTSKLLSLWLCAGTGTEQPAPAVLTRE